MGAPELPNDPGDDDLRTTHITHNPPAPSDDSENELMLDESNYDGYQPLAMDDTDFGHIQLEGDNDNNSNYNREGGDRFQTNAEYSEYETAEVGHLDSNMPQIETVDVEIEREVWNQPRPLELQIELDGNKTQQVNSTFFYTNINILLTKPTMLVDNFVTCVLKIDFLVKVGMSNMFVSPLKLFYL